MSDSNNNSKFQSPVVKNISSNNSNINYSFLSDDSNLNQNVESQYLNNKNTSKNYPCGRNGHAMAIDEEKQLIYLHGGYTGVEELADLWVFSIEEKKWRILQNNTSLKKGPSVRNCHKMLFYRNKPFTKDESEFLIINGKYPGGDSQLGSDSLLYLYYIQKDRWVSVNLSYHLANKPLSLESFINYNFPSFYEHQMLIRNTNKELIIFGENNAYGGNSTPLYSIDISKILESNIDLQNNEALEAEFLIYEPSVIHKATYNLKPRSSSSMIHRSFNDSLIFFGGFKVEYFMSKNHPDVNTDLDDKFKNSCCNDFLEVSLDINKDNYKAKYSIETIEHDVNKLFLKSYKAKNSDSYYKTSKIPEITSAVYNSLEDEMIFFGGQNALRAISKKIIGYKFKDKKWVNYLPVDSDSQNLLDLLSERYSHSIVFNQKQQSMYIFGGKPNINCSIISRLDCFWKIKILKGKNKEKINTYLEKILLLILDELITTCPTILEDVIYDIIKSLDEKNAIVYLEKWLYFYNSNNQKANKSQREKEKCRITLYNNIVDFIS